jgi:hypothetical protein
VGGRGRSGPKNLISLSRLLDAHEEDIEADLAWRYPRDADQLGEFWAGRMSWRRLWVLVSRLPRDAATVVAALGPERAAWSTQVELIAKSVDELAVSNYLLSLLVGGGKGPPPPQPQPLPRPTDDDDEDRG